ncbi:MAG: LysR family transcriptional regulator [Bdellovibrionaceae bacterium]|nr:LysR family transcriptional regulator [Pseudobdellovibrionaceae bacterium]
MDIMDLNEILVFVKVIQAGSFNKAAQMLEMPNSTVSSKVSSLEKRLGVTLIHRTTRKLNLTQVGEEFYVNSLKHIEGLLEAQDQASLTQGEPTGTLKVTAPPLVASHILPEVIAEYVETYPKVNFELLATDDPVDLISENIDLAIRTGKLVDSTFKFKKLGVSYFAPFASPKYLKAHPKIVHPKDLLQHTCLQFTSVGKDSWDFVSSSKSRVSVKMNKKFIINELGAIKELAMSGKGVALLPTFICDKETDKKILQRVLPDWKSEAREVSFIYPAHRFVSPKLKAFIDLAGEKIKARLSV